jgi:hypothetical protein
MRAKLKPTGNENAPFKLLLKGETKIEIDLLQSWYDRNPLGESILTDKGWLRLKAVGVTEPKEFRSDYLPELTHPQRVEALEIRRALEQKKADAKRHEERFDRAVQDAKPHIVEWLARYKEQKKARTKKRRKK